jgi:hypothetical protein
MSFIFSSCLAVRIGSSSAAMSVVNARKGVVSGFFCPEKTKCMVTIATPISFAPVTLFGDSTSTAILVASVYKSRAAAEPLVF